MLGYHHDPAESLARSRQPIGRKEQDGRRSVLLTAYPVANSGKPVAAALPTQVQDDEQHQSKLRRLALPAAATKRCASIRWASATLSIRVCRASLNENMRRYMRAKQTGRPEDYHQQVGWSTARGSLRQARRAVRPRGGGAAGDRQVSSKRRRQRVESRWLIPARCKYSIPDQALEEGGEEGCVNYRGSVACMARR